MDHQGLYNQKIDQIQIMTRSYVYLACVQWFHQELSLEADHIPLIYQWLQDVKILMNGPENNAPLCCVPY